MARSTLDPDNFPARRKPRALKGHDTKSLGPGDSSDSGSDIVNVGAGDDEMNGSTGIDRVVGPQEAGLGGGLDQAEEGRLGTTDEEIEKKKKKAPR